MNTTQMRRLAWSGEISKKDLLERLKEDLFMRLKQANRLEQEIEHLEKEGEIVFS